MTFSMRQHGAGTAVSAAGVPRLTFVMRCLLVVVGAAVAWHDRAASAGVIIQSGGANFLAFEAEDFHSLVSHDGKGFVAVDTTPTFTSAFGTDVLPASTNASGGAAIIDDIRVGNSDHSSTVAYRVIFQTPGTYRLYVRDSAFEDNDNTSSYGNEDSFFRPPSFNSAATITQGGFSSGSTEGTYGWRNLSGADYTVTAADVGQPLVFNIDDRESGFSLDRMVFSTSTGLNSGALDGLVNGASVQGATHLTSTGDWSIGTNWDNGEPDAAKTAFVGGGLTATIDQAGETAGLLVVGHNETVSPGDGAMSQTGGDLTLTHDLILGQTGRSGAYRMTGGTATVGGAVLDAGTSTLQVDEGTMTVAGGLSVDSLRVGLADADGAQATLTVNGGAVQIGAAGTGTLDVGLRTDGFPANAPTSVGVLDLGATSGVTIDVADIRLGVLVGGPNKEGQVRGDLILSEAGDNSVTADSILAGDSPNRGNQVTSTIQLGAGANTISTDKLTLGGQKSSATLTVAAGGTLALGGKTGAAADLDLGFNVTGSTGTHSSGTLDMRGGALDATLGQVRLGQHNQGTGSGSGTLIFDAGVVNAASVAMGLGNGNSSGTITMNGGTMNVSGNVTDGPGTSTINVNGGTLTVNGDLNVDNLTAAGNGGTGTIVGLGAVNIGSGSGSTMGLADTGNAPGANGIADFSSAASVTINVGSVRMGIGTDNSGSTRGELRLSAAGPNTVTAGTILMGDSNPAGNTSVTSEIILGGGTNDFNVNSFTVAGRKSDAKVSILPGGSFDLTGTGILDLSRRTVNTGANTLGEMDLADAASVNISMSQIRMGTITTGSGSGDSRGIIRLSDTANTISADTILMGDSPAAGNTDVTSQIFLGAGSNTFNVDTLTVGSRKSKGEVALAAAGTFTLGGNSGSKADLRIGYNNTDTGSIATGNVDLSGGTFNATLGEVVVGLHDRGSGGGRGTLTMDAGTVTADTIVLGWAGADGTSSNPGNTHGTWNHLGGSLAAGLIRKGHAGSNAVFNFQDGALHADQFGTAAVPFDLDQDGGTLAPGSSIGTTTIYGNYNQAAAGTLEIEIAGTGTGGTDYDFVMVEGDASLAGYLDAVLLGGFLPDMGDYFDVLHSTTGVLDIADLTPPAGQPNPGFGWWEIATVPGPAGDGLTLRLSAVPEPGTWLLLLAAGVCGLLVRRRR